MTKKNRRKLKYYKNLLILCSYMGTNIFTYNKFSISEKDYYIKASESVFEDICNSLNYHLPSDDYLTQEENNILLTKNNLSKFKSFNIDKSKNENLDVINNFNNLNTLVVSHSELLTDEDINLINESNIKEVVLFFDLEEVNKIREEKFDLKRFKNKIIKISIINCNEHDGVIILNYLRNYNRSMFDETNFDYERFIKLNNKIDYILKKLEIDENTNTYEKIYKLLKYTCEKINFDSNFVLYNNYGDLFNDLDELKKSIEKYDEKIISEYLNNESRLGGISNYSSLMDILLYKTNIKSRILNYTDENLIVTSSLNLIYLDDGIKIINVSYQDLNRDLNLDYKIKLTHMQESEQLYKEILYPVIENLTEEIINDYGNPSSLDLKKDIITKYYNVNSDGEKVYSTKEVDEKFYYFLYFNTISYLCISLLLKNLIDEKYGESKTKKLEK